MKEQSQGKTIALINAVSAVLVAVITTSGGTFFLTRKIDQFSKDNQNQKGDVIEQVDKLRVENHSLLQQKENLEQENQKLREKVSELSSITGEISLELGSN